MNCKIDIHCKITLFFFNGTLDPLYHATLHHLLPGCRCGPSMYMFKVCSCLFDLVHISYITSCCFRLCFNYFYNTCRWFFFFWIIITMYPSTYTYTSLQNTCCQISQKDLGLVRNSNYLSTTLGICCWSQIPMCLLKKPFIINNSSFGKLFVSPCLQLYL